MQFKPQISVRNVARYSSLDIPTVEFLCRHATDIRLINKSINENGISFLKYFHLSFYEFLNGDNPVALDLHSDERPDRYRALLREIRNDFEIRGDEILWKVADDNLREEFVRIIFDIFRETHDVKIATELLTNRGFCKMVLKIIEMAVDRKIVPAVVRNYYTLLDFGMEHDATLFLSEFSRKIAYPLDPLIKPDEIARSFAMVSVARPEIGTEYSIIRSQQSWESGDENGD